ncbi:unnamed protein product [Rhizophagus irregularis]|nr:unnamed protein product [Rhizophagus irregularis]
MLYNVGSPPLLFADRQTLHGFVVNIATGVRQNGCPLINSIRTLFFLEYAFLLLSERSTITYNDTTKFIKQGYQINKILQKKKK